VAIQRTAAQGPFLADEVEKLKGLVRPLSDAATLTRKLGFARVEGLADALELIGQPCVVFDDRARALTINAPADRLIGAMLDVKTRTLALGDPVSQARFDLLLKSASDASLRSAQRPAVAALRDRYGSRHIVRAIGLRGWARYAFTGARALLIFEATPPSPAKALSLLRIAFGLTAAEARLAMQLCSGVSVAGAAARLGITRATARSALRTIFSKTDTHRQGELIALLAQCIQSRRIGLKARNSRRPTPSPLFCALRR
jgi:DNA-binding CsgD family transcriptional regulator